jgi:Zn-dependent protease/predicted transcriptional regulator
MQSKDSGPRRSRQARPFDHSLKLGTVAGIEIRLDSSLLIIFALLVYLLAGSVFPNWHPDWNAGTCWLTAAVAVVLFFASVLAHELAHSLVAGHFGIPVPRITLFLFGGLAEIEKEPENPSTEFLIAIAGPLTSLALGLVFSVAAGALAGPEFAELWAEDSEAALATLAPLATLLFWLGPINIVLGLFNLVPGFPLDGGRVLRAVLWWITGDLYRATRVASDSGRMFGWALMALGAMQALAGAVLQGLWLLMIGWFLANAASASYKQLVMRDMFRGITARDLMRSHFETVDAHQSVADFIDNYLLQSPQILWPVTDGDELVGLVTLGEVKRIPNADRPDMILGQVMHTKLSQFTLAPETDANQAMVALSRHNAPLAVVENNRVIGLLSQADTMKWLLLHHR